MKKINPQSKIKKNMQTKTLTKKLEKYGLNPIDLIRKTNELIPKLIKEQKKLHKLIESHPAKSIVNMTDSYIEALCKLAIKDTANFLSKDLGGFKYDKDNDSFKIIFCVFAGGFTNEILMRLSINRKLDVKLETIWKGFEANHVNYPLHKGEGAS